MTYMQDSMALADRYFDTYNSGDFTALGEFLDDAVDFRLDGSALELAGRADMIALFTSVREQFPDRRFEDGTVKIATSDTIVIDHVWTGTAAVDVPAMGLNAGEVVRQPVLSFLTLRGGLVVGYEDFNYGARQ